MPEKQILAELLGNQGSERLCRKEQEAVASCRNNLQLKGTSLDHKEAPGEATQQKPRMINDLVPEPPDTGGHLGTSAALGDSDGFLHGRRKPFNRITPTIV